MAVGMCFECGHNVSLPHFCPNKPPLPEAVFCTFCHEIFDVPHDCPGDIIKEKPTMSKKKEPIRPIFIVPSVPKSEKIEVPIDALKAFRTDGQYIVYYNGGNWCCYLLSMVYDGGYYSWINLSYPMDEETNLEGKFDTVEDALAFPGNYHAEDTHFEIMMFQTNKQMYQYLVDHDYIKNEDEVESLMNNEEDDDV